MRLDRDRPSGLSRRPGHVLRGRAEGRRRIYRQTFIDTYSKWAAAKLYTAKTAITAADLLNDRVLPFFEQQRLPLLRILTDRGTEFCGRHDEHPYQNGMDAVRS